MFDSVRTRLTLWYAAVLALSLIVFAFLLYYAAAGIFYARQDESLHSTALTVASVYIEELEEEHSAAKANEVVLTEMLFPDRYVEVADNSGRAVAWSRNLTDNVFSIPSQTLNEARQRNVSFVVINGLRMAVVPLSPNPELGFAAVAEPVSVIEEGLRRLRRDFYAGVPLILLLTSAGGYFLARKSLLPVELSFKEQQRFVADASHELRTPLAVLRGETEVALSKPRSVDDYKESLALIKDEAERLSRIVEDLFVLARQPIDAPVKLMNEPVSLNEIAGDCVRAAQVLAARKNLRVSFDDDSTALTTRGDGELLKRMLLNLLDNAVKYTPEGGEISLKLTAQNGNARITVRDTGIGIPESDQARIFDRFYRVDKTRSRALGGAGLGLSIVGWIVKAHAGEIHVESEPGRGSTFTVDLRLERYQRGLSDSLPSELPQSHDQQ